MKKKIYPVNIRGRVAKKLVKYPFWEISRKFDAEIDKRFPERWSNLADRLSDTLMRELIKEKGE